jgi:translation elongation factor aEF-1 beta
MGQVLLKYRVMPEGLEVDLAQLEKNISSALTATGVARLSKADARPFAFGMKALHCSIVVEEAEGNNDKVEEALNQVPMAQGVEFLEAGRLM